MAFGRRNAGATTTGRGGLSISPFFWVIVLLDVLAWIVLLAGVASLQSWCATGTTGPNPGTGSYEANKSCAKQYSYPWWIMVFQIVVLLGVFHSHLAGFLQTGRLGMVVLLGVVTVLLMDQTNDFYGRMDSSGGYESPYHNRVTTWFVGSLLSALFNLLLIVILGHHVAADNIVRDTPHHNVIGPKTGTTTTGTTASAV